MDTVQKCSREYQSLDPAIVETDVLTQLSQPCAQPQTLFVSNPGTACSKALMAKPVNITPQIRVIASS
ncbi:hypothetical protein QFZ84_004389 [Pseudomonas fluorescens]